jgi:hypothetical protein
MSRGISKVSFSSYTVNLCSFGLYWQINIFSFFKVTHGRNTYRYLYNNINSQQIALLYLITPNNVSSYNN